METIQVNKVTPKKQGVKNGKAWTISEIETIEGRKFDTFDSFIAGQEFEVEIVPNSNPAYNANVKKVKKDNGYASAKQAESVSKVLGNADEKEQRITMLSCLSSAANFYQQRQGTEDQVMSFAKRMFHQAMGKKMDDMPF